MYIYNYTSISIFLGYSEEYLDNIFCFVKIQVPVKVYKTFCSLCLKTQNASFFNWSACITSKK